MLLDLRQDDAGTDFAAPIRIAPHHRGGGFIAACLDSKNIHSGLTGSAAISGLRSTKRRHRVRGGGRVFYSHPGLCVPTSNKKSFRALVRKPLFLRIGTRGSALALWQAEHTRDELCRVHGVSREDISIDIIRTSGDRITDRPLSEVGGKGLFTKEIEDALLAGAIDIAVHSAKDMPTELPEGLELSAFLTREDVRDAFLSPRADRLMELPKGAVVGSASLRRQALIRRIRPDLRVINFRGNVGTRLYKLASGEVDATLLAYAGLKRLQLEANVTELLDVKTFPPALGQGCVCVESRVGDERTAMLMSAIDNASARAELTAERAFLGLLDGSCRTPIAGLARAGDGALSLHGLVAMPDGSRVVETRLDGACADAEKLGREAGRIVLGEAGEDFMAAVRAYG
ncbi:MAG: hydroxymethylbilane synthase [Rhodobiaceae bacterium]|nr:hydroxymethylbilane synthase [Rhodobiaceae bacterium]